MNPLPDELALEAPAAVHRERVLDFVVEFGGASIPGGSDVQRADDYAAWTERIAREAAGVDVAPGCVPADTWFAVRRRDDRLVGVINLRHELNDYLKNFGGHIGYAVRPTERRRGYAARMLALALDAARRRGMKSVLVTCDRGNVTSTRTILRNGGTLENEIEEEDGAVTQRYWIAL